MNVKIKNLNGTIVWEGTIRSFLYDEYNFYIYLSNGEYKSYSNDSFKLFF